jgi:hypothetical protein
MKKKISAMLHSRFKFFQLKCFLSLVKILYFLSVSFYHFVKMLRYMLIEALTNSIIELSGRLVYLVNTLNHARSAFFHSKNRTSSWIFLIVLSNIFFLQKHKKRRFVDPQNDMKTKTILKESCDQKIQTIGEGEE